MVFYTAAFFYCLHHVLVVGFQGFFFFFLMERFVNLPVIVVQGPC